MISRRPRRSRGDTEQDKKPRLQRLKEVLPLAWDLLKPRLPSFLLGLLLILISRSAGLVLPATAKVFVDDVVGAARPERMRDVFIAIATASLIQGTCGYLLFRVMTLRTIELVADLRIRGIAHLIRLGIPFFDRNRTGTLLPRVLHDIDSLRLLIGSSFIDFAGGVFFALISAVYMWTISPKLTLVALVALLAFLSLLVWAFWGVAGTYAERARLMSETMGRLSESLSGIRVIKAYRAEERESAAMARAIVSVRDNAIEMAVNNRMFGLWSTLIIGGLGFGLMALALSEIQDGRLTLGGLTTFSLLLGFLNGPVYMVVALSGQIVESLISIERLQQLLAEPDEPLAAQEGQLPLRPSDVVGEIAFENVTFSYQEGEVVLNGVSFKAPPGTATALVGPSGAGKSTMMALIAAFYRPQAGRITLDGRDIASIPLADYRSCLGVVFQETFLFDASLRDNVLFARPEATEAELLAACRSAHVEEFVPQLPAGYDTIVGERGVRLSGGQRQRVALARAFLANPRILLLDEATSSLDSESESLIQEGLERLLPGRTTIVIAHRLSTVRSCHQILVVQRGRIIETGTHADLMKVGGRYSQMLEQQMVSLDPQ